MIDEIFQEYKKQEKDNILLMTKHYGIDVKCLLYPNINNDLIVILDSVNLLNDEVDSFKLIDAFYEKIIKKKVIYKKNEKKQTFFKVCIVLSLNNLALSQ